MSNLLADINETVSFLGEAIFDVEAVVAACDENCRIHWSEDDACYLIRSANGTPRFVIEVSIYKNAVTGKAYVDICEVK